MLKLLVILSLTTCLLVSCAKKRPQGPGAAIPWKDLPGWKNDTHSDAWPALLQSCHVLKKRQAPWKTICSQALSIGTPDNNSARHFFEKWFVAHIVIGKDNREDGLFTGYFEPLLFGSLTKTDRYKYPVYGRPADLLTIDLSSLHPQLKGLRLRGRVVGHKVVPYYNREAIEKNRQLLKGHELLWVDDAISLFFLQIQGSGKVQLANNKKLAIGYVDQNGHPYFAIGRELINLGALTKKNVSLQSIRKWLIKNPEKMNAVLNTNPSYVFFEIRDKGPLGSLGVPLTAERSIAVDRQYIKLGLPVWIDTTLPAEANASDPSGQKYRRLMFAQDTGGAISGAVRADVFWGAGKRAKYMAGHMKQNGRLFVLLPKNNDNME